MVTELQLLSLRISELKIDQPSVKYLRL